MFCILFSMIILFMAITAQEDDIFIFSQDKNALSKCIQDYLYKNKNPNLKAVENVQTIAETIAKKFYGRFQTNKTFTSSAKRMFYHLQRKKSYLFRNNELPDQLRWTLREALVVCAENRSRYILAAPSFADEPRELADVLNYILVEWPPLRDMIQTRNGRAILRSYAEDAGVRLANALDAVVNHEYFRYLLRVWWMQRARFGFDGYKTDFPYLSYRYSIDTGVYTYGVMNLFYNHMSLHYSNRDPPTPMEDFNRIMYIHVADRPGYGEFDVFSIYLRNGGMTSAQYYIETHIDQFYRILFFFMELSIRGISTDEEDTYEGTLPSGVVPTEVQEIVYDDQAYRNYLLSLRERLEKSLANSLQFDIKIGESLSSAHVWEEDLISLLSFWMKYNFVNITVETSSPEGSSTPDYDQLKRKESALENDQNEHFCKRSKESSDSEEKHQCQENDQTYGYLTYIGDSNQKFLKSKESKFIAEVTNDAFKEVIEFIFEKDQIAEDTS